MALPFTSSKRPFEGHPNEPNGREKWQKTSPSVSQPSQFKVPPGSVVFRLLCPSSKCGSVIGKGGGIVAKIHHETGARIKLEDIVFGCDERVVAISGPAKYSEFRNVQNKLDDSDSNADGCEDGKASAEDGEEKEDSSITEGSKSAKATSSVQKALLLIFERIIEGEQENDDTDKTNKKSHPIRLLVFSSQVGCLLGKGGSVIKQMSTDSGAQIRILPRSDLPLCASPLDEIVQIAGSVESRRRALQSVSQKLMENPPRDSDFPADNPLRSSSHPYAPNPRLEAFNTKNYPPIQGPPLLNRTPFDAPDISYFPKFHEGPVPGQMPLAPEVLVFRLLCSNDMVGCVIGKGGNIVENLQHETGCVIKVLETSAETEYRIIVIYGPALPGDRISPSQEALLRVLHRIFIEAFKSKGNTAMARLLVAPNQTGCLLGNGGSIIAEMRKLSGAHIRILSNDLVPKGVSEHEEIVQVSGEYGTVREAILQITARLRGLLFHDKTSAFLDQMSPFGSCMGREHSPPPRLYAGHPHEDISAFAHPLHGSPWVNKIAGSVDSIRKTLQSDSQQLMVNPPRDCDFAADNPPGSRLESFNTTNYHMPVQGPPFPIRPPFDAPNISSFHKFHEGPVPRQMPVAPEVLVLRLLCSNDIVGSVIGKGGNIVKNLQHETGCEIKVLETAAETENRVIVISGPALPGDRISPSQDALLRILHRMLIASSVMARLLVTPDQTGCLLGKGGSIIEEMRKLSGARILIFSKDQVPKGVAENDEAVVEVCGEFRAVREAILQITARFRGHLFHDKTSAFFDQMPPFGSYMGREPSPPPRLYAGARPREDRSAFAHPIHGSSWFNKIVGRVDSIRKALQSVSQQLMENPPRDCDFPADIPSGSSSHPYAPNPRPEPFNTTNYQMPVQGPPFPNKSPFDAADISSFPKFHEGPLPGKMSAAPEVLIFRLLCSKNKVGSVIGKGGNIVKNLQHETGCEINVLETAAETEYRIIAISGPAVPGDRISPSQDALLRIFVAASESKDNTVMARLLVTPSQTGCLLGKGGSIIEEMRKLSGAHIRVFGNDLVPKGVSENDEAVQVSGEYGAVREAILQITSRLRGHLFHDKTSAFLHQKPPSGSYMGREPSPPPRLYAVARPHQGRSAFARPIHGSPCFNNLNVRWH